MAAAIKKMYLQVLELDTRKNVPKVDENAYINLVDKSEVPLEEAAAVVWTSTVIIPTL